MRSAILLSDSNSRLVARNLRIERAYRTLFEDINVDLPNGKALAVHGPNGSGKTTLLRVLCGLTWPSAGAVSWNGLNINENTNQLRTDIVYIGHTDGVKLELTVRENLEYYRALAARPSHTSMDEIAERRRRGFVGGFRFLLWELLAGRPAEAVE